MTKGLLIFTAGVITGGLATWALLRKEYERRTQEEINSVQETWARRHSEPAEPEEPKNDISEAKEKALAAREKPSINDYAAKLQAEGYINYTESFKSSAETEEVAEDSTDEAENDEKEVVFVKKPYVIEPHEFGEIHGYEQISLTYYSDEVLTDEDNELVDDVDNVVGLESLTHFGEYEDDSVFVRNDRLRADYEILLDNRKYSDVVRRTSRRMEE